jgi:hypothetical protein
MKMKNKKDPKNEKLIWVRNYGRKLQTSESEM